MIVFKGKLNEFKHNIVKCIQHHAEKNELHKFVESLWKSINNYTYDILFDNTYIIYAYRENGKHN